MAVPPEICTTVTPVMPRASSEAMESSRTGVLAAISMRTLTRPGSVGLMVMAFTAPTFTPLNSTSLATLRPETCPVKLMSYCTRFTPLPRPAVHRMKASAPTTAMSVNTPTST